MPSLSMCVYVEVHVKKNSFMFTNKEHTRKGIMATILGVISLASLVYIIVDSYTKAGRFPCSTGQWRF